MVLRVTQILGSASQFVTPVKRTAAVKHLVAAIRRRTDELRGLSSGQLRERSHQMRMLINLETPDSSKAIVAAFSIACEALQRSCGVRLYDVQLMAAVALAEGAVIEMQTGEGKTFASAPAAYLHALTGRGVHVATPNAYLARRDFEILLPAYRLLGVTAGLLPERDWSPADKRDTYRCDITYGTGYEFGFDYLRDQLSLRAASSRQLGSVTLESLFGMSSPNKSPMQRGLSFCIVDEADNLLLDDATSPLILSGAVQGEAPDAKVHHAAECIVAELREGTHYLASPAGPRCRLTETGMHWIHENSDHVPVEQLQRTWADYVENALAAAALQRDVHYVVTPAEEVHIVDCGTGRIFSDRTWREGLQQAVEAKEGVPITPEKTTLAQITRQRFSRLYERLSGMTGTAHGCERELRQVYGLRVVPIPLRTPSLRKIWPTRFFATRSQLRNAIVVSVLEIHHAHRPVLVGTANIAESELLAGLLREAGCLDVQLLNGRQDADEATIIASAGRRDAVTIATNLAGRGTDIKLKSGAREVGGLHVIVSECSESERIDRQLIGRCGRQGDPGSAQLFVSAEDALILQYGHWLAHSIKRHAGSSGESEVDFSSQLSRIQRAAERANYSARTQMLRRDLARVSLFARQKLRL